MGRVEKVQNGGAISAKKQKVKDSKFGLFDNRGWGVRIFGLRGGLPKFKNFPISIFFQLSQRGGCH